MGVLTDLVVTEIETTGSGTIPAGATEVSIINNGTTDATLSTVINTGKVPGGSTKTLGMNGRTYPIIYYNANGNQVFITVIR